MKDMIDRIRCEVPGCGRTFKRQPNDPRDVRIICGSHWRLSDKWARTVITRLRRRGRRYGWSFRMERLFGRLWERCRQQAIERSMGI